MRKCDGAVEGVHETCCIHPRPSKKDQICCWCGDLFEADATTHGTVADLRADLAKAQAERDALKAQLADAEKVLGFVRHPWRIEHIGFTGLYDVVRSPPSGRETLGHGSYPKSIAQTCCDAANREPVDNYDSKWRAGK